MQNTITNTNKNLLFRLTKKEVFKFSKQASIVPLQLSNTKLFGFAQMPHLLQGRCAVGGRWLKKALFVGTRLTNFRGFATSLGRLFFCATTKPA